MAITAEDGRRKMANLRRLLVAVCLVVVSGPVGAWGELGHEVTALIAYRRLPPATRSRLDALLLKDTDPLTQADFASRAVWADRYRSAHGNTSSWHYVDIEIDEPDLSSACRGFPALRTGQPASNGPAQDCIVDKIIEFEAELSDRATSEAERLMALKFLIHFLGDLHQPLHAADHKDHGGNCIHLVPATDGRYANLHAYWDIGTVRALGETAPAIAAELNAQISQAQSRTWGRGSVTDWAQESFALARKDAYALPARPTCREHGTMSLSPDYQRAAVQDAALQLQKAGVRMAVVLERALSR